MVVAFLAQPAGRSHSLYTHLPLFRSHSPPQRCPSSPTFRTPRGRLRTAQLMNSIAGTGTSPFRPPGGNTLYIHTFHSLGYHPPPRRSLHAPRLRLLLGVCAADRKCTLSQVKVPPLSDPRADST